MSAEPTARTLPVAIVGGGISGLATAWYLAQSELRDVELFEAADRFGGPVGTDHVDGYLLEHGPDSFLVRPSTLLDLIAELGLADDLVTPHACDPSLLIWARGKLRAMPPGLRLVLPTDLRAFMRSNLLTRRGKLRVLAEPLVPARQGRLARDESMGSFFRRRMGSEVVDTLIAPILANIYSGDPDTLSIRSTFPRFPEMVERHGSLLQAARRLPHEAVHPFRSLRRGMGSIIEALVARLEQLDNLTLHRRHRALAVRPLDPDTHDGARWALDVDGPDGARRTVEARELVLAVPAYVSARLLSEVAPDSADLLATVPYTSTAGVYLALDDASRVPTAAGVLFQRVAGRHVRGIQLGANKYDGRAPSPGALLRVFLGGVGATDVLERDDEALVSLVRGELAELLGIHQTPRFTQVMRYPNRAPQYTVGHADRVAHALARLPAGLHLVGNAYRGVGLPACVEGARDAAHQLFGALGVRAR